ncbi:MAG: nickel-dependent lactate racemase family protein [Planctomycetota bacterium]|jgi:nickel-dependent lactate racemase
MAAAVFEIPYGKGTVSFTAPGGVTAEVLKSKGTAALAEPTAAVEAALADPLGTRALRELAHGCKTAVVVISDITRPVPNALILPPLLCEIEAGGVPREGITLLIGTGTHRHAPPDEIRQLVGASTAAKYRVVNHDCRRGNMRVGAVHSPLTGAAIPVFLDRLYVRADLRVVTGLVEPHIFCGYSGGRKALLPGIAALTSIRRWHGPELIGHPRSTPGTVKGNLAHRLSLEASRLAPPHFALNVTLERQRKVTGVFGGDPDRMFTAAVSHVESYVRTDPVKPAKVVVTSSAGWPLDATFYQAIKGLVAVLPVLAPGGIAVLAAEISEGIGDAGFTDLIRRTRDLSAWSAGLPQRRGFRMGQWQLQRMSWVRERGGVFLVSGLSAADTRACFAEAVGNLRDAVARAVEETGAKRMLVVPEGPYVVTRPERSH